MLIEINGQKVGLKFNKYAFEELSKMKLLYNHKGEKIDFTPQNNSGFAIALIYCAYKGWCFVKQNEPELTFETISDWYDLTFNNPEINNVVEDIFKEYRESEINKFVQKKTQENGQLQPAN